MTRFPLLLLLAQAVLSGMVGALAVTGIWLVVAGETPSPMPGEGVHTPHRPSADNEEDNP
ncbi:hypothetical protein ACWD0G_08100 [Streptomyces goshikiensis]